MQAEIICSTFKPKHNLFVRINFTDMMDTIVNIRNPEIYISYGFTDITGQSINKK